MKITLCMIVKNEEQYIKMCLEEALKVVDNAIVVDTGSTDKTKEIIKTFGSRVELRESTWSNDFSEARNKSIAGADGEWIMVLDADEKLICSRKKLEEILQETEKEGFFIPIYSIVNSLQVVYSCVFCKLFRNNGYRYNGAIHENVNVPPEKMDSLSSELCKVIHYGYLETNVVNKNKLKRNMEILKKQHRNTPNDPFVTYNIANSYLLFGEYDKALKHFLKAHELTKNIFPTYKSVMLKNIAECLFELKDYNTCIDYLNTLLEGHKESPPADLFYVLANCYYEKNELLKAETTFKKCIEIGEVKSNVSVIGDGSFKPKFMLARIYEKQNRITEATMQYMEAIFDPYNFMRNGKEEVRSFLNNTKQDVILKEFDNILKG